MSDARNSTILIDVSSDDGGQFEASFLEKIGHAVLICNGPGTEKACPLVAGDGCPKFDDAHGIVFELDLERPQHRAIVRRYRQLAGDAMPIAVLVPADQAARYAELLSNVNVWTREPTVSDLDGFASKVEAADRFA